MSNPTRPTAALYVRASTEHQNYSTRHQENALRDYAKVKGIDIVAVYRDEGRSGLNLDGRVALTKLLRDVQAPAPPFGTILVFDVSRWGRFQDIDESAYYEFACRRAGITVSYCAEMFANDGSPLATMLKAIKRAMAAEFSRELSGKVFRAQCNLTRAGFKQGGAAGYGLRRQSISASAQPGRVLEQGERKSAATDRVIYVAGPQEEIDTVERIYAMYIDHGMADRSIAAALNAEGITHPSGRWSDFHIKNVLTNPKYAGTLVFNRSTQLMRSNRRLNDRHKWITVPNAFAALIAPERFEQAQIERHRRNHRWSNGEMLDGLRQMLATGVNVTYASLDAANLLPCTKTYKERFGSFIGAMHAAGIEDMGLSAYTIAHFKLRFVIADLTRELERCALAATDDFERITCRTYRIRGVVARLLCTRRRAERTHPC